MESLEPEICNELEKRDARGRRLLSKEQWAEMLSAYERSDMTQKAFCRHEGLNHNSFVYQLSLRRSKTSPQGDPSPKFRQLQVSAPEVGSFALEVDLPCGSVVRGNASAELAQLIRLLRD
ncbi:IS66 family insertion sequence element accessory protein TnpA [Coraliomargarita sp. W4R53]